MKRNLTWFERMMTAITYAEANCPDEARGVLTKVGQEYSPADGHGCIGKGTFSHPVKTGVCH
ncbi:MAG: hypothetical protein KJ950_11590 [Proteobacteria bacterium]|nr:hypothetical protein [Pseudomonadota bacterium]MBU1687983.1 hypothetical protein [Pseudomonadota bacterium]